MNQQYSQVNAVPLSIGVFLATDNYDHNDDPNHISVTTLIKPLRQIILGARVPADTTVDLMSMMASRMGTAIHEGIERAWLNNYQKGMAALGYPKHVIDKIMINPKPEDLAQNDWIIPVYMEQRYYKKVGKWIISGQVDFVGQGRLEDFKTAGSYVVMTGINDEKFRWQGSVYRWIAPEIITNDQMAIQFILTDWSSMQARQDPNYPQQRHVERMLNLEPLENVQRMVFKKLDDIERYWDAPEDQLPECTEEDLQRSAPKYKYYKNGDVNAARSTKNFEDKQAAYAHLSQEGKGAIKEVPGTVGACRFCKGFMVCSQKDRLVADGSLTL